MLTTLPNARRFFRFGWLMRLRLRGIGCAVIADVFGGLDGPEEGMAARIDWNIIGRIQVRYREIFRTTPPVIPMQYPHDDPAGLGKLSGFIAGFQLADLLHAGYHGLAGRWRRRSVIVIHSAPRGSAAKSQFMNGADPCSIAVGKVTVVFTYSLELLAVIKRFGLAGQIKIYDKVAAAKRVDEVWGLTPQQFHDRAYGQATCLELEPDIAALLAAGYSIPGRVVDLADLELPDIPQTVWWVDPFGNCKLTIFEEDVDGYEEGAELLVNGHPFTCRRELRTLRDGEHALVVGSSGLGLRCLELMIGAEHADVARKLGPGSPVTIKRAV